MKKTKFSILAIMILAVVSCTMIFSACVAVAVDSNYAEQLSKDIAFSRTQTIVNYKTREIESNTKAYEKIFMYEMGSDKNKNKSRARFIDAVQTPVNYSATTLYYGASLKSGVKAKNATDADYKNAFFHDINDFLVPIPAGQKAPSDGSYDYKEKIAKKDRVDENDKVRYYKTLYRMEEITMDEFLNLPTVAPYNFGSFLDKVQLLVDSKIDPATVKVTKQGRVLKYTFSDIGVELATMFKFKKVNTVTGADGVEVKKYPCILEITNGRVSMLTDSKESATFSYQIAYGIPVFDIPSWDKVYTDADLPFLKK